MPKQLRDRIMNSITVEKIEKGLYLAQIGNYLGIQFNGDTEEKAREKAKQLIYQIPIITFN